jgi:iron(III) transport system ATP-binding protein
MARLTLTAVSKRFGDDVAVEDISLDVAAGESLVLLGPSGCGKTTLLRVIAGLTVPDRGTVRVDDELLTGPGVRVPPERRRLGLVFQDWALFPHLSVADNVAFGLSRRERATGRVEEVLTLVRLEHLRHRRPHELSGGQAQRVAIARALAPRPRVMLFDEAFSNLDAALRVELRAEVADLMRRLGMTACYVTHDQDEAFVLGDRIAVLRHGRLVQVGTPTQVYGAPASTWVASFVGDANVVPADGLGMVAHTLVGALPVDRPVHGTCRVLVRPEHLSLVGAAASDAAPGQPYGQVIKTTFYGHDSTTHVAVDGHDLLVRCLSAPQWQPGDMVGVRHTGDAAVVLPAG